MGFSSAVPHARQVRRTTCRAAIGPVVALVVSFVPLFAQVPTGSESLTVEAAMDRALGANPTLIAARLVTPINTARLGVARERPNPEARVELERETPKEAYGVAIPLELGGKRGRRIAVGEAEIGIGEAQIAQATADVRAAVRLAYFGAVATAERFALLQELRGIAARAKDAAQQRFDAGGSPRLEVLQADLALAQAENETTTAGAEITAARAELNALLGLPPSASPQLTTSLDEGAVVPLDAAMARAQTENVDVRALDREIEAQRARVALAKSMQVPDVTPEATVTRGAEPEFSTGWRAGIALAVPIFTRHRAGVLVEEATLAQITAERAATLTRLHGQVAAASALVDARRQQYARYRDQILPQAVDVERMAEDSYRLGQTGITGLLQALQATRDARLRALQAGSDFQTALANLERAIGAPLP
jgi:outer membrane protein, heavy metal efflux system